MNDEHLIILRDLGDRSEDFARIVIAIVGHRRQHHERADVSAQQAVAVGIGARDRFCSQTAGGARTVLDHDGLSERARQVLTENPGADIDRTARRERHDHFDRTRGIGLLRREAGRDAPKQAEDAESMLSFPVDTLQRTGLHAVQSTLMPVSFAIAAHRGASAAMNAAKSCGEPIFASALNRARPACASLDLRISLTAPLSLSTIARRRSRRRQQPRPERGHELGISALGRGRHVRQQRRARIGRHRQRAQPPAFDVRQKNGGGLEDHLHLARHQVGDGLARRRDRGRG